MLTTLGKSQILLLQTFALFVGSTICADEGFNWDLWRSLPVQNGGRQKPLDTLGWETLRGIANRASLADPDTGQRLDPTAAYLTMLFDWHGWAHRDRHELPSISDWRPMYLHLHPPDKWDRAPLLQVDYVPLRTLLGLEAHQRSVSPDYLANTKVQPKPAQRAVLFSAWGEELRKRETAGEELSDLERKGLELANRFWSYQNHRMGRTMEVLPIPGSPEQKWMPLAHLVLTSFDDATDPTGSFRQAQQRFSQVLESFRRHDTAGFNRASQEFVGLLKQFGGASAAYPTAATVRLEVAYNRFSPFRIAWLLMLVSAAGMLLHSGTSWKPARIASYVAYFSGLLAMLSGFALRIAITGRPPVTNMYESVVYVGAGVAVMGLIFELLDRRRYVLTAAATVASVTLLAADSFPLVLDPSMRPLEPVLRSNFWLVTHVLTITLSYAALALALGIANITLGYCLVRSENIELLRWLSRFTYRSIQVGVLLLATGVALGGVWADYSWGRFWGWDPKEVWALVALLGYLAVLHARYAGWVSHRGLAFLSVACFSLVVMAWYGVNFVLGAGLHSYGFGGGGQGFVYAAVVLQLLYASLAMLRSMGEEAEPAAAEFVVADSAWN